MLRKLLIAVLVLGLISCLSSTAFSTDQIRDDGSIRHRTAPVVTTVEKGETFPVWPTVPVLTKLDAPVQGFNHNAFGETPKHLCEFPSAGPDAADWYYTTRNGTQENQLGARYDMSEYQNHNTVVYGVMPYFWTITNTTGTQSLDVFVYEDLGGIPGALMYTETYAGTGLVADDYNYLPFATPVAVNGSSFYITLAPTAGGDVTDEIQLGLNNPLDGSDPGTGVYYSVGDDTWYDMTSVFSFELTMDMYADACTEYSECDYYSGHDGSNGYTSNWGLPDNDWNWDPLYYTGVLDGFGMEFFSDGPDSIKLVTLQYLRPDIFGPTVYDEVTGSNGFIVSIWGDDAGDVDVASGPLAQVTLPGGFANLWPDYPSTWQFNEIDFSSFNLVLQGPWHVTVQTTSPDPADGQMYFALNSTTNDPDFAATGLSVNAHIVGTDPDENWHRAPLDPFWQSSYVADRAYLIYVDYCKDEFYSCDYEELHSGGFEDAFWIFGGNIAEVGQKAGGEAAGSRISFVRFQIADEVPYGGTHLDSGDPIVRLSIRNDLNGVPGSEVYGVDLTWTTGLVEWPGWTEVVIPDVIVYGEFWITYTVTNTDGGVNTVNACMDLGAPDYLTSINSGGWVYYNPWSEWISSTLFGFDANNFLIDVDYCTIPPSEAPCDPGNDNGWATYQGDQARTGASNLALNDAWCKLNLNWNYMDALGRPITLASPVIYGDQVVISISDPNSNGSIVVLNLADGTEAYSLTNTLGDGQVLGFDLRCTPTILNMDVGGVPTDVMFIGGGTTNGIAAVDFATGALIWSRTILNVGVAGLFGQTRYSTFTVLDQGGTMVVYTSTDLGKVVALEAETGALFTGWATNPVDLGRATLMSGTTDGVNLVYTYYTTATEGDIIAIDAATGVISWQLSTAGGLQAVNLYTHDDGYNTPEGFRGAVSYDSETDQFFACSYANLDVGGSDHPTDGVMYMIDAGSGNLNNFSTSGRCLYATPTVDKSHVFVPTYTKWAEPPAGGDLLKYNKSNGSLTWAVSGPSSRRYNMSGIRTCEPGGVDDLFVVFNDSGILEFWNSVTGEMIFSRRIDHGGASEPFTGLGGAFAKDLAGDAHLVFVDLAGGVYDMVLGDTDRQRASFDTYRIQAAAEFGVNPNLYVDFGPLFRNNGCADLTVTSVASDANTFGGLILAYAPKLNDDDMVFRANSISDELTLEAVKGMIGEAEGSYEMNFAANNSKFSNSYSSANPDWLNGVISPAVNDVLTPGDEINLVLDINQPNLTRGSLRAFVQIGTDDPDFFLNEGEDVTNQKAEVLVTLVGGCLLDTTTLHFGIAGANSAWITNTMMLGDGDWAPPFYEIDGDNGTYYQGALGFANSKYAVAISVSDWWSNTTDEYVSIQGDPVWCATNVCSPVLNTGVSVGAITADGITYTPILADYVCKTFIDSVQNFDTNPDPLVTEWEWDNPSLVQSLPFDDTLTMGLTCDSRAFGVHDVDGLDNFVFEIFDFTNRNATEINDWALGHMFDPDGEYVYAGTGGDASYIDRTNSICWTSPLGWDGSAMFTIKIPFGCGELDGVDDDWDYLPPYNAWGFIDLFSPMDGFFDTMHYAMTNYTGVIANDVTADDSKGMYTLARHNFEGNGTYSLGLAYGQFVDLTVNTNASDMAPTAHLINKWAGFGRGDVNDDGMTNLADIIYLANTINGGVGAPGAIPFAHLSDVNADGAINTADLDYMINYYFYCGPCPLGDWMF